MPATLERQSRQFAAELSGLLNGTVTNGLRLAARSFEPGQCVIGRGITRTDSRPKLIPLTVGARPPTAFLQLAVTTQMDDEARYLAVRKCSIGVVSADPRHLLLCRYDYVREPGNPYPSAHLQVGGWSDALDAIAGRSGRGAVSLPRLHLPVGGRRFRPAVEDVVEMVIVEGLVDGREGWAEAIARYREVWFERQLRAAVRRRPGSAADPTAGGGVRHSSSRRRIAPRPTRTAPVSPRSGHGEL